MGAVEISFHSEKDATNFVRVNSNKYLGGNKMEFKFLARITTAKLSLIATRKLISLFRVLIYIHT